MKSLGEVKTTIYCKCYYYTSVWERFVLTD